MLRKIADHLQPALAAGAAGADKPTILVMMGFGDGVRPPIMTGSVAKDVMDAFDPSLHEILGADTATLLNLEEAMAREGGVDAVMTVAHPPLGPELMDQLKPKVISNCGVGVMHIDLDAASERSIPVGNTPGVLNEATADMAMALMLACARRLPETDSFCKTGQWLRYEHMDLVGQDVSGSTVGIIGMGRIGSEIAKRAKFGFNCKVLYHNRNRRPEVEAELGVEYASKDELLAQSDTVIVIVSTTDVVIDAAALKKMKPTASLVNVARGPTVDTEALTAALQAGEIAGAGLDVLDPEPPPTDHPIYSLNNVILAPHRGSATVKTRRAMAQLCVDNLLAGIEGRELLAQAN